MSESNSPERVPPRIPPPLLSGAPPVIAGSRNRPRPPWVQFSQGVLELGLKHALRRVHWRDRQVAFWCKLAGGWVAAAALAFLLALLQPRIGFERTTAITASLVFALAATLFIVFRHARVKLDTRSLARRIEARHPDLDGRLLTAVQQTPGPSGQLGYLQERLLRETLDHSRTHDWAQAIPGSRVLTGQLAHWLALALFVLGLLAIPNLKPVVRPKLLPVGPGTITVTPGDALIEKGSPLVVLARFDDALPPTVDMVVTEQGSTNRRVALTRSLADPVFGGSVPELFTNLSYRLEYAGQATREFNVTVFEHPRLEKSDIQVIFPGYTGLAPRQIPDTRRLSAVEGSTVEVTLVLNKPVASAALVSRDKDKEARRLELDVQTNQPLVLLRQYALNESGQYDLQLTDVEGRTNKVPARFVFDALPNRPPELKIASPAGDLRPSPLEEISFEGEVWDDFGVQAFGIAYSTGGADVKYIQVGEAVAARQKGAFQHVLRLEELGLRPDQLVSWFVWADDIGPDGQPRRSPGDLYFAEVRPFEEIFREGQGMEGQGQQGESGGQEGNQAGRLAELQKSIISATWKLLRQNSGTLHGPAGTRQKDSSATNSGGPRTSLLRLQRGEGHHYVSALPGAGPGRPGLIFGQAASPPRAKGTASGGNYEQNASVVHESQAHVLEQLSAGAAQQADPKAAALWTEAARQMEKAVELLEKAKRSPESLPEALAAEQAAYQALLKLQEHEYQVSRSRRQSGGQQGGSRDQMMQRQLDEMELTQSENRYETQRQAQRPQNAQRREELAVLDQLRELARRQQDFNQRLKELQSELREAKSQAEREEIQRRLKRLQEQQQQMLADVDELRQRMDRPENQSRMAEQREQLEQTRQDMQQAAEAAGQGSPSQALASGTRAERQLEEMREEIRKDSSSEFAEDMREMRSEARELAREQERITRELGAEDARERKSLSGGSPRQEALQQLAPQQQRLTNLLSRATEVSQQAESSEPLLSKELYESLRKLNQESTRQVRESQEDLLRKGILTRNLHDRLKDPATPEPAKLAEIASEMLRLDLVPQAADASARSAKDLEELRKGVERAAESVLGDDTEALRQAQQELDELTRQLEREVANAQRGTNTGGARGQPGDAPEEAPATAGAEGTNDTALARAGGSGTNRTAQARAGDSPDEPEEETQSGQATETAQNQGAQADQAGQAGSGRNGQPGSSAQSRPGGTREQNADAANADSRQAGQRPESSEGEGREQADARSERGGEGEQAGNNPQTASSGEGSPGAREGRRANRLSGGPRSTSAAGGGEGGGGNPRGGWDLGDWFNDDRPGQAGPLTGDEFLNWSERLRDVEDMIDEPGLRNEVAAARERARSIRQEYKRELKKPDWAVVRLQVMKPLAEVRQKILDELARRDATDPLVPIDRDPVPGRYSELVRRYYEELGRDRQ